MVVGGCWYSIWLQEIGPTSEGPLIHRTRLSQQDQLLTQRVQIPNYQGLRACLRAQGPYPSWLLGLGGLILHLDPLRKANFGRLEFRAISALTLTTHGNEYWLFAQYTEPIAREPSTP